jgi:hypothetical protein
MTKTKIALINLATVVLVIGSLFVVSRDMPLTHFLIAWGWVFTGLNIGLFAKRRAERGTPGYQPRANLYIALSLFLLATIFPDLVTAVNRQAANQRSPTNATQTATPGSH